MGSGICVNCRYQATSSATTPSFKGDRILVMMFPYDLPFLPGSGPPERWDVVVFRYPEEPEVSYIKRLVGLPGETIRIAHGDVYVKPPGGSELRPGPQAAARTSRPCRSPSTTIAIAPRAWPARPEWTRWRPDSAWKPTSSATGAAIARRPPGDSWSELRYHHLVPDPEQWDAILNGRELPRRPARR